MKKNKQIPSIKKLPFFYSSMLVYGEWWVLVILIPLFFIIMYGIWRDYHKFDIWPCLIIALGSLPVAIRFFIKPPNPFGEGWLQPRTTAMFTDEERKALTFLKSSKIIKRLALKIGIILFCVVFLIPLIKLLQNNDNYYISKVKLYSLFIGAFLYYIFSHLFFIFIIYHYLITHWDEIQQLGIEPWPKDKPYSTGPFRYHVPKDGSLIGDILAIDPNMPFNWHDFLIILAVFLSICLIFWGVSAVAILFNKTNTAIFTLKITSLIIGIVILNISARIWYRKHKKK